MTTSEIVLMFIKSIPALLLVFVLWPLGLGAGLGIKRNIDRYIIGFCAVQALFFLCYIPAFLNSWSSRTLTAVATVTISVIALVSSGLHPLILCKTVMPVFYLPTHYLIIWRNCFSLACGHLSLIY